MRGTMLGVDNDTDGAENDENAGYDNNIVSTNMKIKIIKFIIS